MRFTIYLTKDFYPKLLVYRTQKVELSEDQKMMYKGDQLR